jgi:hypothetical protein
VKPFVSSRRISSRAAELPTSAGVSEPILSAASRVTASSVEPITSEPATNRLSLTAGNAAATGSPGSGEANRNPVSSTR